MSQWNLSQDHSWHVTVSFFDQQTKILENRARYSYMLSEDEYKH